MDPISEFERIMIRLGIDHATGEEDSQQKKKKQNLKTEALVTMARIKENKKRNDQAAKDKEARLLKMMVDQAKSKRFSDFKNGSGLLEEKLQAIFRKATGQGFQIIKKFHRKIKEHEDAIKSIEDMQEKRRLEIEEIENKRREIYGDELQIFRQSLPSVKYNLRLQIIQEMKAKHEKSLTRCLPIANLLVEFAESCYNQLQETEKVPQQMWNEWIDKFIEGKPPNLDDTESLLMHIDEEEESNSDLELTF